MSVKMASLLTLVATRVLIAIILLLLRILLEKMEFCGYKVENARRADETADSVLRVVDRSCL